jgi:hypothetical protein
MMTPIERKSAIWSYMLQKGKTAFLTGEVIVLELVCLRSFAQIA